ncbi:Txe/YoeB family addiction module toxin [Campylobacter sp. RM16192]|uniref:Txe/YoeB family addiction module toxin n=1 Tax=Campylobacter sp. RM16192 TaxID=1660080 RepID=UPI001451B267|nr:Txe/YoeB family addiction module toxin [Campylobacter sp. RM16192]QCD52231.1 toxin-antitoxin system, toxin component, Txe/YoeB family [Campylobacter sp. RM16192]
MPAKTIKWTADAWSDYLYWQKEDKSILKRINMLIKDISRNPFDGIGKPEGLKGNLSGFWSRRIDSEYRLVYLMEDNDICIIACKGHYDN